MAAALLAAVAVGGGAGIVAGVAAAMTMPRDIEASAVSSPPAGGGSAGAAGEGGADDGRLAARDRILRGAVLALAGALIGALVGALTLDLRAAAAAGMLAPAVLAITDLDRRCGLIADAHSALVAAAGLIGAGALVPGLALLDQAIGLALGLTLFAAVKFGARALRGVDGLGGGDVLLAGAGGLWTGWLWFGPWIALAAGATLVFAALTGRLAPGARIAFGPELALSLPVAVGVAAMVGF